MGIEQAAREREAERRRVMPRSGEPRLAVGSRPRLSQFTDCEEGDGNAPERKAAVQVGPEHEQRHVREKRASRGVLQQLEQHDHEQHGEEVGAGQPVGRAQHRRCHANQVCQERIAALADEVPCHQRIGEREDQAGQHRHPGQARGPVGQRVNQLAAVLEREEGLSRLGEREEVLTNQPVPLKHDLAQTEMACEVAVAVQQPVAEPHRYHDCPDDEDDVEERGSERRLIPRSRTRGLGAGSRDTSGRPATAPAPRTGLGSAAGRYPRGQDGGEREGQVAQQDAALIRM